MCTTILFTLDWQFVANSSTYLDNHLTISLIHTNDQYIMYTYLTNTLYSYCVYSWAIMTSNNNPWKFQYGPYPDIDYAYEVMEMYMHYYSLWLG